MPLEAIAWGFDGVLNRNRAGGKYLWATRFEADWQRPFASFHAAVLADPAALLTGQEDLTARLAAWCAAEGLAGRAEELRRYWFSRDSHPDTDLIALVLGLKHQGIAQRIATNSPAARAGFIAAEMGWDHILDGVTASGELGVCKPDPAFFAALSGVLGAAPGRSLLVDASADCIAAAEALGWHGYHLTEASRPALERHIRRLL